MKGKKYRYLSYDQIDGLFEDEQLERELGGGVGGADEVGLESAFIEHATMQDRYCEWENPLTCW